MEAINQAGSLVGIKGSDGVAIFGEKKTLSEMLERTSREKNHKIADHVMVAVAGLTSDGATLVDWMRQRAQQYQYQFQAPMPVEQLVKTVADNMHLYTQYALISVFQNDFHRFDGHCVFFHQTDYFVFPSYFLEKRYGGLRPFGVSFLVAGWDKHHGFQLIKVCEEHVSIFSIQDTVSLFCVQIRFHCMNFDQFSMRV